MSEEAGQAKDAWQEVGQRFEQLGNSLATTVRAAWENEEVRGQAEEMKTGLESLVKQVEAAIKQTAESQEIKQAAGQTGKSVQVAGEQTVEELRPHLVDALQQLDQQLQKLIRGIESGQPEQEAGG